MIIFSAIFYAGVFYDNWYSADYMLVVAATIVLFSDLTYACIGAGYLIINRAYPVSKSNIILAFAAIPLQTLPSLKQMYEPVIGPVSDMSAAWAGLAVSAVLLAWCLAETVKLIKTYPGHFVPSEATR
ncbi:MAG: hypothetical protein HZB29_04055 [Nitrospinae bacterium]|nr:hypothetical protein [Nitrospinota bacterium]